MVFLVCILMLPLQQQQQLQQQLHPAAINDPALPTP